MKEKSGYVLATLGHTAAGKTTLSKFLVSIMDNIGGELKYIEEGKIKRGLVEDYSTKDSLNEELRNRAYKMAIDSVKDTIEQKNALIDASFHKYSRRKMLYDMMLLKEKSTFLVWLYCFCPNVEKVKDRINKRKDANNNNMIKVAENQADSMEIYNHIIETFDLPSIEEVPSQINCAIISFNTDANTIVKIEKNSELVDLDLLVQKSCENVTIQQIRWREMK